MSERREIADFAVEATADEVRFYKKNRTVLVVPRKEWAKVKAAAAWTNPEDLR